MKEKFKDSALSPKERAEDLLPRLTLREKVGQVNQKLYGFQSYTCNGEHVELADSFKEEVEKWSGLGVLYGLYRADPWANKDYTTGLTGVNAIRAYNLAQHYVLEHSRFGIPMLMSSECPHGHQALDGYLLPVNLGMGAAWNPKLVEEGFKVVGEQQKEMGVDFALVSMLDILRDPRWGRSEECYGEDPYLCGQNAAAAVKGCASAGLEVVAKHFCAQGETTGGVNASAARIGERELREIHLPAMKEAVKAGATVQLYIQGVSGTIVRRVRELKAFEKVYLQPGEKKTVELKLDCDALSIWNRKMQFAPEESKVELYVEESGSKVWNGELKITK